MDPVLRQWLKEIVTWESFVGYDGRGKPTYKPPYQLKCYIQDKRRILRSLDGEEFISRCVLITDDVNAGSMMLQDRITLPSGEQLPIRQIDRVYDDRGEVDHYEIYV